MSIGSMKKKLFLTVYIRGNRLYSRFSGCLQMFISKNESIASSLFCNVPKKNNEEDFISRFIVEEETWIHHSDAETKV